MDLRMQYPQIPFARIIGTNYYDLLKEYQIQHFPSIHLFTNGVERQYVGPYNFEGVSEFIQNNTGNLAKPLHSISDLDQFVEKCHNCAIYLGAEDDGYRLFELEAKRFPKTKIGISKISKEVTKFDTTDGIAYYRNFQLISKLSVEKLIQSKIRAFFSKNYEEEILPFDKEGAMEIFGKKNYGFVLYTRKQDSEYARDFRSIASFLEVAK